MLKLRRSLSAALVLLAALAVLASCQPATQTTSQAERMAAVDLVPRQVLFGNPDRIAPRLSPDASRLAYLAPHGEALNVWVGPLEKVEEAVAVTRDDDAIRQYYWAHTNRHILYLQDEGGNENNHLYVVDLDSGDTRDLTPMAGVAARVQGLSPRHPEEVLVLLNDRQPQFHDLYRINIRTGERRLEAENEGFLGFTTDRDFNVRFASRYNDTGGIELLRRDGAEWQPWQEIPSEDSLTTQLVGFDESGEKLFLLDSRERDTAAVVEVDLVAAEARVLSESPKSDAGILLRHPTAGHVQAVAYTYDRRRWEVLDPSLEEDFVALRQLSDGELNVTSRSLDDSRWIVSFVKSDGPVPYYLWDRAAHQSTFLFTNRDELQEHTLARMHPVVVTTRDGLDLVNYLTLPPGADPDGDARPEEPLPMLLLVHGGPWGRDNWGLHPWHQLFANRGYAVLSVNFRGSTGFGKSFVNAGDLEWGRKMHDDLLDSVEWAVAEDIAIAERVGIMGGSYGGYATLAGLTMTPEVFAAGVDLVGPSNLNTLLASIPPYWAPMVRLFKQRMGDPDTEEGRALLKERSPLTYAADIRSPLLIGQGANDPRVKRAESDQIAEAMAANQIPVTYLLFPDEGHGFSRPANNLAFMAVAELFLARHLGGRSQAVTAADFEGSSIQVLQGGEGIEGLQEALPKAETPSGG